MEVTADTNFVYGYFKKHEGRKLIVDNKKVRLEDVGISYGGIYLVFSYKNYYKRLFIDGMDDYIKYEDISTLLKRELNKWAVDVEYKQYFDLEWE